MANHDLKVWPMYFDAIKDGRKRFELRKDDRGGYKVADTLLLREWSPDRAEKFQDVKKGYTGRFLSVKVTYVLPAVASMNALRDGCVCMAIELIAVYTPKPGDENEKT